MEGGRGEGTLIQLGMEENKCYPCNGLGYHIETCIEADGTRSRVKISCACCDGSGESK